MSNFIDYAQVLADMRDAVLAAPNSLGFKRVTRNADDMDFQFQHMPMCDFRIRRASPDLVSIPNGYYSDILVEAEVAAYSMTSRDKCVTMCQDLTNALQGFFRENTRFGAYVDSTIVGVVEFEVGETKAQGEFVAAAVVTFHVLFSTE